MAPRHAPPSPSAGADAHDELRSRTPTPIKRPTIEPRATLPPPPPQTHDWSARRPRIGDSVDDVFDLARAAAADRKPLPHVVLARPVFKADAQTVLKADAQPTAKPSFSDGLSKYLRSFPPAAVAKCRPVNSAQKAAGREGPKTTEREGPKTTKGEGSKTVGPNTTSIHHISDDDGSPSLDVQDSPLSPDSPFCASRILYPKEPGESCSTDEISNTKRPRDDQLCTLPVAHVQLGEQLVAPDGKNIFGLLLTLHNSPPAPSGSILFLDAHNLQSDAFPFPVADIAHANLYTGPGPSYLDVQFTTLPESISRRLFTKHHPPSHADPPLLRIELAVPSEGRALATDILRHLLAPNLRHLPRPSEYRPLSRDGQGGLRSPHVSRLYNTRRGARGPDSDPQDSTLLGAIAASKDGRPAIPKLEQTPRLLFIYPPGSVDAVAITSNELLRLADGVYLNDSLIDFDLRCTYSAAPPSVRTETHIFSCFFYRKLTENTTAAAVAAHSITKINIFQKRLLLLPINEQYLPRAPPSTPSPPSLHWYLALIWDPAAVFLPRADSQGPGEEERTVVVIFDSLGSKHRRSTVEKIKNFIVSEALARGGAEVDICKKRIAALYPRLPLQRNLTDCGCFMLEYADRLLRAPEETVRRILCREDLSAWFDPGDAARKRTSLRERIEALQEESAASAAHVPPSAFFSSSPSPSPSPSPSSSPSPSPSLTTSGPHRAACSDPEDVVEIEAPPIEHF